MWWVIVVSFQLCRAQIKFTMKEEQPVDYFIGNIYKGGYSSQMTNDENQFKILNQQDKAVDCFKITDSGNLKTARKIDREKICPKQQTPGYSDSNLMDNRHRCIVTIQVAPISTKNNILTIEVEIEDINDNKPQWTQSSINVKFIDGCNKRTKVLIPQATDPDVDRNGFIEYSIAPKRDSLSIGGSNDNTLAFRIIENEGLYLETITSLDREEREKYELTLTARDKGEIVMSNQIDLTVIVEDINDNVPLFISSTFRFPPVSENCQIGTKIGQLVASDKDSGSNGQFYFSFAASVPDVVKQYFSLGRNGEISVRTTLDVDRGVRSYKFRVIVQDLAVHPYTLSSEASVIIDINDVNDELPQLKVIFINKNPHTNQPEIQENSPLNSLIGVLEATDLDFNGKDSLSCKSENSYFNLNQNSQYYKYNIITQARFDSEKKSTVMLQLSCQDLNGNLGTFNRSIAITDVNDNSPTFTKSFYTASLLENSPVGTRLSEPVVATDKDSDKTIRYHIMPGYTNNFTIDSETGIIYTKVVFDRETCSSYIIKVLATDSLKDPINTGTGTIQLIIEDENDNAPIFQQESYTFHVAETNNLMNINENIHPINRMRGLQKVGSVTAIDLDDEVAPNEDRTKPRIIMRKSVYYRLDRSEDSRNFQIDHRTGEISTVTSLDRELRARYIFPVFAEDSVGTRSRSINQMGVSLRHTVTTTVTVLVDDVNDNAPKFIMPNATHNTFEMSELETVGHKIALVHAEDLDAGENQRLHYNISGGNSYNLFAIDESSGLLLLRKSLLDIPVNQRQRSHTLTIKACDNGLPKALCTDFRNLRILIYSGDKWNKAGVNNGGYSNPNGDLSQMNGNNGEGQSANNRGRSSVHQEAIVICLAVLFVVLVAAAGSLVCLLRCKSSSNISSQRNSEVGNLWGSKRHINQNNRTMGKDKRLFDCSSTHLAATGTVIGSNTNSSFMPNMVSSVDINFNNSNNNNTIRTNKENMRNMEKRSWNPNQMDIKSRPYGYVVDHTNRTDYQTLESLCLASNPQMPQFIDPCTGENSIHFQTMRPSNSSFYSYHDLKIINNNNPNENTNPNPNLNNFEHPLIANDVNLYQSMEPNDLQQQSSKSNTNNNNNAPFYNKLSDVKTKDPKEEHPNNQSSTSPNNNNQSKYSTYLYNEASFV